MKDTDFQVEEVHSAYKQKQTGPPHIQAHMWVRKVRIAEGGGQTGHCSFKCSCFSFCMVLGIKAMALTCYARALYL